ncbi:CHASE2 domain-containing protein [Castellaniella sp. FW104-16D08]|uniref:CHASE2 domain-containing protein n=1 Tax=unclassified Castellaniella TaxID=2617606 RepID=UPI00331548CB
MTHAATHKSTVTAASIHGVASKPHAWFRAIAQVVLILLLAYSTLGYSWFGTSTRADQYLHDLFNTYAGNWLYPDASEQITVLLLTDESVDHYQQGHWPARYDFHAQVLNTLLRHKPAAVFIDFLWLSQRPTAATNRVRDGDYLIHVLQRYKAAGIPVYLSYSPGVVGHLGKDLRGLVRYVSAQVDLDYTDFVYRRYPVNHGSQRTAAFRMAEDADPARFSPISDADMDIFWGTRPNRANQHWMAGDHPSPGMLQVLHSGYTGVSTPVPYTTTLYVRDLLNPRAQTNAIADQQARDLLQNRFVMYGGNLSGVQDLIFTPTRQLLPGVYLHAMALDNLLHWGKAYKSSNGTTWIARAWGHETLSLLFILPVALVFAFFSNAAALCPGFCTQSAGYQRLQTLANQHPLWMQRLCAVLVGLYLLICATIEFHYFGVSASSLAGYIAFIALGYFLDRLKLLDWMMNDARPTARSWANTIHQAAQSYLAHLKQRDLP